MFSVMWSEHCSYKSVATAAADAADRQRATVVAGPGENAGVIAIGDGLAVAFKIESHNHPQRRRAVPGCRDRRRRDPPRHLHDGCAADRGPRRAAVWRSGRCRGPGTSSWRRLRGRRLRQLRRRADDRRRAVFDPSYAGNPLVNVMAIGLLEERHLTRAAAPGPGNLAVLFGSTTGRDGIGGASVLATATFGEEVPPSARPCRSAIRSRGSCSSRRHSSSSKVASWRACRTWARPG